VARSLRRAVGRSVARAPMTFVVSLFTDAVRVYAVPNLGRWYDFGFMLGIGGFSGGVFAGSRKRG